MLQLPKRDTGWDFFFSGSIVVRDPSRATPGDGQLFVLLRAFSEACVPWVTHSGVEGTSGAPGPTRDLKQEPLLGLRERLCIKTIEPGKRVDFLQSLDLGTRTLRLPSGFSRHGL